MRSLCALFLALVCLPAFAAGECATIESLNSYEDVQTGQVVVLEWTYSGGEPQSQILTGKDFPEPVVVPAGQTYYNYLARTPGEKHAQLSAVTACGTTSRTVKYHVKKCNLVMPELTTSASTIEPGQTFTASVPLEKGLTATWEVTGGVVSSTTGGSIQITANDAEYVAVNVRVSRGNCSEWNGTIVPIVGRCSIAEPQIHAPEFAAAGQYFGVYVPARAGETTTLVPHGAAEVFYNDGVFLDMVAPATGSFSVDVVVSNGTCERTFTRTWTVGLCNPTATVSAGASSGSCGANVAVAEFTGTAPWQGYWSDNEYFYTDEPRIERALTTPGTYSITFVSDRYCMGTTSGSVTAGASFPKPAFTVDPIVDGYWYDNATCPGMERVARLDVAIPAGAQVEWSVQNATILSGQGTSELHFAATAVGPVPVTAVFRDPQGCSQSHTYEYMLAYGKPQFEVTIEPAAIPLGGTAIITVRQLVPFTGGIDVTSSLGDTIVPRGGTGEVATWEYRSSTAGSSAVITVTQTNSCLDVTTESITVPIDASNPVPPTAVVTGYGSGCDPYVVATFTGIAPFSGTWSNGETFSTSYPSAYLFPSTGGTYTITEFSDAGGAGTVTGSATFDFVALPAPEFTFSSASYCPGTTVTATLTNPVPEGATVMWSVYGGTILSGDGTPSIVIQGDGQGLSVNVKVTGPNACSPWAFNYLPAGTTPYAPIFDLYGVYVGGTTQFTVYLDPGTETWGMENSMGDVMEVVDSPSPNVYNVRYTSSHGTGESQVRIWSTTACGETVENTRVMQVLAPRPTATLTSTTDEVCGATLTATFTGTPPFTATWADNGETFTTSEYTYTRRVGMISMYTALWNLRDANGTGNGSNWVSVQPKHPGYVNLNDGPGSVCVGTTATYSASDVPAGWEVIWVVEQPSVAHIVSGQGTAQVVISADAPGQFHLGARYRTPDGCEGTGSGYLITVPESCP